jgi:hypothetical protein
MVVVAENTQTSRYDSFVGGVCDGGVPLMVVVAECVAAVAMAEKTHTNES